MAGEFAAVNNDCWRISSGKPLPMNICYGDFNNAYFTLKICHGGKFADIPGHTFKRVEVSFVESLHINRVNMDTLRRISEALGYKTVGKWFFLKEEVCSDLEMVQIEDQTEIDSLIAKVVSKEFKVIEQVYLEHEDPQQHIIFPEGLMIPASKRIEKIVFLLLVDQPTTTVAEAIVHVERVLGLSNIPPNKIAYLMYEVRKFLDR